MDTSILSDRPKVRRWTGQPFRRAEVKHDGYRLTIHKVRDTDIRCYARKPEDLYPKLAHQKWMDQIRWGVQCGTVIDGELLAMSCRGTDVASVLAGEQGQFCAFAVPVMMGDRALTWREHDDALKFVCGDVLFRPSSFALPVIGKDPPVPIRDYYLDLAESLGVEGFVLKDEPYANWYKLKPTKTVDCVVKHVHMGTGTRFMMCSSYDLGLWDGDALKSVGTCKVLDEDDAVRWDKKKNRARYEGRVCEVEYDEVAAKGRLKFARFLRWRDDKPVDECTMEQLNE